MKTREERIIEIQEKMFKARRAKDFISEIRYHKELRSILDERESDTLGNVVKNLTADEHYTEICMMVRMFVFADMMYGAAIDFKGFLTKFGIVDIPLATLGENTAKECRNITREIDNFKDEGMSEAFGQLCDECNMMVMNKIYSREAKLKDKIMEQHKQ